jgi:hypothetical protein
MDPKLSRKVNRLRHSKSGNLRKSNSFLIRAKKPYLELDAPSVIRLEKKRDVAVPLFDKYLPRGAKLHGYFEIQNSAVRNI